MQMGEHIRRYRKHKGLTQAELAQKLGLSQNSIASYENNTRRPEAKNIPKLAKLLGVPIDALYGAEVATPEPQPQKTLHRNSRSAKVLSLFEQLPPNDQRSILKQMKGILGQGA